MEENEPPKRWQEQSKEPPAWGLYGIGFISRGMDKKLERTLEIKTESGFMSKGGLVECRGLPISSEWGLGKYVVVPKLTWGQ